MNEEALYPQIIDWLQRELSQTFPRARVEVEDTHGVYLSAWVARKGLTGLFPEHTAWDIKVDITGVIHSRSAVNLVLTECKTGPSSLRDVGQILGYSLVARPRYALLVSMRPPNARLMRLLRTFGREDILKYPPDRSLKLITWDCLRRAPDMGCVFPANGRLF
jgi:hypothetical protein